MPQTRPRNSHPRMPGGQVHARDWRSVGIRPSKPLYLTLGAVALLIVALAILLSSPDERPTTIAGWSRKEPINFLATALAELSDTSVTAEYGPPYNDAHGSVQSLWFFHPQTSLGVTQPIDTARDYVLKPLHAIPDQTLQKEIAEYESVETYLKEDGWDSFEKALRTATVEPDRGVRIAPGLYENVEHIMLTLLRLAQSGGLDGTALNGHFFQLDYTRTLRFMSDGGTLERRASAGHLPSGQWPMMDETGNYPGQAWMWPYAVWYQVGPIAHASGADLIVIVIGIALSALLLGLPFVPILKDIPRWIPVYRLIWRFHYRSRAYGMPDQAPSGSAHPSRAGVQ